jgi:hypothetical protein
MAETLAMAAMGGPDPTLAPADIDDEPMLGEDLPLEDEPLLTDEQVLRAVRSYKEEARQARETRMRTNERNWAAYYGDSTDTHKLPGQAREVVPKVSESVEALAAFVKRSLTDFQAWFSVTVPTASPIPATVVQKAIQVVLDQQQQLDESRVNFPTLMSDAMKVGSLGALMIFKVSHYPYLKRRFVAERGLQVLPVPGQPPQRQPRDQLVPVEQPMSAVVLDLIPPEDYYPDPSGRNLYVIHTVERDLEEVQTMADLGAYDPQVVAQLQSDFQEQEFQSFRAWSRNQDESSPPSFRKKVVLDECWATFLDDTGRAVLRNAVATVANDKYVIRPPVPNPYWHQQSPFVDAPLIRIPFSTWHKAVQDNAVSLNNAQNELLNLIIDGGYEAVWGVRQMHLDWLEDPTQVQDGISPGDTLLLKQEVPANAKVLERVTTGGVPQDALAVYNILDREYNAAAMVNDVKMGMLPEKSVKATEIVAAEQHSASTFDGMVKDIEDTLIEPLLWKIWLTVLQFLDDFSAEGVIAAIGERWAYVLASMSPAQRYAQFAGVCQFQASGLSATLARGKDLQKLLAFVDVGMRSPFLAQTFIENYSAKKYLDRILQTMNLDPESLELSPEEKVKQMQQAAQMQAMGQQAQPGGGAQEVAGEGIPGVGPGTPQGGRALQGSAMPPEGRAAPGAGPGPSAPPGAQPSVPPPPPPMPGPMPGVSRG